ncbi:2-amino-4-hydroxy-6-hydroxymethyldihydropteridine diphosphokinase [Caulobacter sp. 17J65-9]|uniref:2-amino-4-hydroxy-6- hydroxymethyldihydropteridine diphosphokinase n=1 Tax=Caulobacter sp. 17J65-9 TaxID=2709382 RepID=UPI0013C8DF83|nr:2-amino-4-hydroxy-6-hydroxymethyldihydropteridine diphosphokinase [Caulobacter sp. 17J65-9]NEX92919.1 2-amino-4-hydroxy-6-hydroxymethyldihydropteridine diphosphokinase [Caulobacter sp. 17J65-9]
MTSLDQAVVVALGSNLKGDQPSIEALLEAALDRFAPEGLTVVDRSSWWRSAAWPDPTGPAYLNGVAIVETGLKPLQVLAVLRRIEGAFGRRRGEPNAARTLDLDLIAHGRTLLLTDELVLPHPRAADRRFVMGPLAQIAPGWTHPETGATAADLAVSATVGRDAAPV